MKVIDLLNKIANGEEVPKIFIYADTRYYSECPLLETHKDKNEESFFRKYFLTENFLNKKIKIIEEDKKIEKINMEWFKQVDMFDHKNIEIAIQMLSQQLNELIDEVNKLKGDKNEK